MAKTKGDMLAAELSKLGGFLSGLVSRTMPNNVGEVGGQVPASVEQVLHLAQDILGQNGQLLDFSVEPPQVVGVIGGGYMGLNPVHVTVSVQALASDQTKFMVEAVAKEGLIKQRAGEQIAALVAERIVTVVNTVVV